MKRLLYCTDAENIGGAEHYLRTLLLNADQQRYMVGLVMPPRPATQGLVAEAMRHQIDYYPLEGVHQLGFNWRIVSDAVSMFRRIQPAIIHFVLPSPRRCAEWIVAAALARVPQRIVTFQLVTPIPQFGRVIGWLRAMNRRIQYATVHHGIAVSQGNADLLRDHYRFPGSRLHTMYNAVDVDSWQPQASDPTVRAMWGIPDQAFALGIVGRLSRQKGHRVLFAALPEVWRSCPNVHVVVVGSGELESALRSLATTLDKPDHIHFIGQQSDMRYVLANLDLFVLPSLYEGLSFAVLEAMAMQRPIIASEVDGTREAIHHEQHGLLVPPDDAPALTTAIIRMVRDQALRSALALNARQRVSDHFNQTTMLAQTYALYQ